MSEKLLLIVERAKVIALEYIVANLISAITTTIEYPRSILDFTENTQKLYIEQAASNIGKDINSKELDECIAILINKN